MHNQLFECHEIHCPKNSPTTFHLNVLPESCSTTSNRDLVSVHLFSQLSRLNKAAWRRVGEWLGDDYQYEVEEEEDSLAETRRKPDGTR